MSQKLIIAIPYHMPRELSSNASRECPQGLKNRLLQDARDIAKPIIVDARNTWEKANDATWEPLGKCVMKVTFYFAQRRRRDRDNLYGNKAWKAIQDMLVESEIILDDNSEVLTIEDQEPVVNKEIAPLILLEISG